MKFIEIIEFLKRIDETEELISLEIPNVELGLIDVYLKNRLDMHAEVKFFDVDTIPNNLEIDIDGEHYVNLFPLAMTQEMVQDYYDSTTPKPTNSEIAMRLLEYRVNDA